MLFPDAALGDSESDASAFLTVRASEAVTAYEIESWPHRSFYDLADSEFRTLEFHAGREFLPLESSHACIS